MISKKAQTRIIVAVLAVIVVGVLVYYLYNNSSSNLGTDGRAVFTITDKAANLDSVSSVQVTVDKIEIHSASEGWITLSSTPRTYDLIQLRDENMQVVLADTQLKEGTYEQARLDISEVVIVDASGSHEAKLPSGELKIVGDFDVKANQTESIKFDFIADESLHKTGNGTYILAPVVQVETRESADVNIKTNDEVEVSGGRVKTNIKVGMDEKGNVGVGLKILNDANLSIGSDNRIKIGLG
jgi:hypothetical protein